MNERLLVLILAVVGGILVFTGFALMRWHALAWRQQQYDPSLDQRDRRHYYARFRRRMQTSALLALLGLLVPLGYLFIPPAARLLYALYWIGVLLLALWVVLLGLGDLLSTGAHSRAALARVRRKQRELEKKLAEFKSRDNNGGPHAE